MLKVLPVQTKERQEELCRLCGVPFRADLLAYAAFFDDVLMGVCQFKLTAEGGMLYDLSPATAQKEDAEGRLFEAMFVMGRGTLNFIDLCGVHRAFFVGKDTDDTLLRAIGFSQNEEGNYEINLEGFFTDHCGNHKDEGKA